MARADVGGLARCVWDGDRSIDDLTLAARFETGVRWVLESAEDLGRKRDFVDPRTGVSVLVIDSVIIAVTCQEVFRLIEDGPNLIGCTLVEFESALGRPFVPDSPGPTPVFECKEIGMYCIVDDHGTVVLVSLEDFEAVTERPDPSRHSGAG